jgi:hypothetical protein
MQSEIVLLVRYEDLILNLHKELKRIFNVSSDLSAPSAYST